LCRNYTTDADRQKEDTISKHRVWTEKPNQERLKVMLTSEPKSRGLSWRMPVETTSPWPTVSAPSTTMVSSMARDAVQQ